MRFTSTGFTQQELGFILRVLDDPRAWGERFMLVPSHAAHDIAVHKLPNAKIKAIFADHPNLWNLSVCDRRERPIRIYFSAENWGAIPQASGYRSMTGYRIYVVLHEFGHALGHGHAECPAPHAPAPVMMQQTLGTGLCFPDPWVKK